MRCRRERLPEKIQFYVLAPSTHYTIDLCVNTQKILISYFKKKKKILKLNGHGLKLNY